MDKGKLLKEYNTYKKRIIEAHKNKIIKVDCAINTAKYENTSIKNTVDDILPGRTWINRRNTKMAKSTHPDFEIMIICKNMQHYVKQIKPKI